MVPTRGLLLLSILSACGAPPPVEGGPLGPGGKSDGVAAVVHGLEEGSPEGEAVLRLANTLDGAALDLEVGLRSDAAEAIVAHRLGPDGEPGTADDRALATLGELAGLRGVGAGTLRRLFHFADVTRELPYRRPVAPSSRLVAIGDLHGDFEATRQVLQLAGAIDETDAWVGGDLVVVQVGDVLDRGDGEARILDLLERLDADARAAGGAVVMLLGNHEIMNVQGDFRYVTDGAWTAFGDDEGGDARVAEFPAPERARAAALLPGGRVARRLARHDVVALVGDTLFAHAGVLPHHVDYGLDEINHEARAFMMFDDLDVPPLLDADDGPVWYRGYGEDDPDCDLVEETLALTGARRIVIGHTVQEGGIGSACDDRLFLVDVGMSAHYGGAVEALEIDGARVDVLYW